jgi:hypothetical protein
MDAQQEMADAEIELRRLPLNQMISNVYCWSSWLGDKGCVRPSKYPSKEITEAVVAFETTLAKSKKSESDDCNRSFGQGLMKRANGVQIKRGKEQRKGKNCVLCNHLYIKDPRHIHSVSHRRRELCVLLD